MSQRILVTNANGMQGFNVASFLLTNHKDRFTVRCLVDAMDEPAKKLKDLGADVLPTDLLDVGFLERACTDVHGVFSVQNYFKVGPENEVKQGRNVANAAKKAGVKHFIYSSIPTTGGEGMSGGRTGVPQFDTKKEIESYIMELGLKGTIIRPVYFMDNFLCEKDEIIKTGVFECALKPGTKLQMISMCDMAKAVVNLFLKEHMDIRKPIDLAVEELPVEKIVTHMSEVLGKRIEYREIPLPDFERKKGKDLALTAKWLNETGFRVDMGPARTLIPEPLLFRKWLEATHWTPMMPRK